MGVFSTILAPSNLTRTHRREVVPQIQFGESKVGAKAKKERHEALTPQIRCVASLDLIRAYRSTSANSLFPNLM